MLRQISALKGMSMVGINGVLGVVHDLYLDRMTWAAKYLVVDTAGSLPARYALVPPSTVTQVAWLPRVVQLGIAREELQASPAMDFARPLYWSGDALPPAAADAYAHDACLLLQQGREQCDPIVTAALRPAGRSEPSLYSATDLATLRAEGADGSLGQVIDLLYEEQTWTLRYLMLDTTRLVPESHVLISTQWVEKVCCALNMVCFFLTKDAIRNELLAQLGFSAWADDSSHIGSQPEAPRDQWRWP